jgi:hypothetical protein
MNYIKLATGEYPRHQGDVRLEYPEMGEPFVLPDTYAHVQGTPEPEVTDAQRVVEILPIQVNGQWFMQWMVRDATQQELDFAAKQKEVNNV